MGGDTLVGNIILKSLDCSGCYFSFKNIILTNIYHAWKVHLTALCIFYRDILQSHEEYSKVMSLPPHGSNCINIYSVKTHLPKSLCFFL